MKKKYFKLLFLLFCLMSPVCAEEVIPDKYPDYALIYLGEDKFENFNRKMFALNDKLNKYAIRPIAVIWSSIMPKYGMDRLKMAYSNILYPRYLISSVIQGDFKAAGRATARFLANSTVGLGGMFDPAKRYLKIKPINEDMEQALSKLKVKQGPYLVVPVLSSSTPRAIIGKAMDAALDPTSYVGSSVIAAVKAGLTINNAAIMQNTIKMVEQNYIDPYDIAKKIYGLSVAILNANLDREETLKKASKNIIEEENKILNGIAKENNIVYVSDENEPPSEETIKGSTATDEILYEDGLIPDIILENFNPQDPVTDSIRTALFELKGINNSKWGEMSLWNRSFQNRIKTASVEIAKDRENYKFRYIMQKDKNSPVAIIYPSIGEGINSHHSVVFAKLFYDEGYSVIIQGSAFHYDFLKAMPEEYKPGIPTNDVKYLKETTSKIVNYLEQKYECKFKDKVVLGTSYGAMSSLFLASSESKENLLNISKYISINPPIDLFYAMNVIDNNGEEWQKNSDNFKEKTAIAAAKALSAAQSKEEGEEIKTLPFDINESKLLTGFVLHQKLSDLIFAIENTSQTKKSDFYSKMNKMNFKDYAQKYLLSMNNSSIDDYSDIANLHSIKDYLSNNNNYRIYHSLDDYLTNKEQLQALKKYSKRNMKLIDKGAHLGFLYREEFINDLKKEISLKEKQPL